MKLLNFLLLCSLLVTTGCNTTNLANSIDGTLARAAGNKPPAFFSVANVETMRDYVFETKDFSFNFPTAKESDFAKMGGWSGMSMRNGRTIAFGFKNSIIYHISVSTSGTVRDYSERDRAIDTHNIPYIKARFQKYHSDIKTSIHNYGKENYDCTIIEDNYYNKWNKKEITYSCYKFNPSRTKAKSVSVSLTYNKPKDPTLAKEYTYEDLKNRAKRMLESLYIKDGW